MTESRPGILLVSCGDPDHVSTAAKLARFGFEVVVASPGELADRILLTLSCDAIIIDDDLSDEVVVLVKQIATFHREALRVLIGGDPADTAELRESGVLHHHLATLDLEGLIPVLRGDRDIDDKAQAGELEANDEVG